MPRTGSEAVRRMPAAVDMAAWRRREVAENEFAAYARTPQAYRLPM